MAAVRVPRSGQRDSPCFSICADLGSPFAYFAGVLEPNTGDWILENDRVRGSSDKSNRPERSQGEEMVKLHLAGQEETERFDQFATFFQLSAGWLSAGFAPELCPYFVFATLCRFVSLY